ncbi:UTP--glucose-1-phosphate uridylyltransferase GalU [Pontiella sulfatireligans]|uniref:UTP--glucose-1-phosphate uridylyltransferase n=1 Tax=Pontiella sulfatireligans TaxID=2750658 RepID=A0A6C2UF86_9BACT|nr:UTP--glucose-1-phosphate uridylyltransferase GalU [Pontiella sulfatireligans]VGO18044.1 UTP--glucose-1-phosphate uridylyltransferase [Pontiella sulfatireligans]
MIRKAVIPAAGFGTRFLPLTKAQPKEMLPIVDTPTIQMVVEEAVESGITDILMVIGKSKRAIEEHFDRNFELEQELAEKGKTALLDQIKHVSGMAEIHFIWQKELNGLGDAVSYARSHIGNEPFALLLGDTILESYSGVPVTKQLMNISEKHQGSVVALEEVPPEKVNRYGIMDGTAIDARVYRVNDFIEKPEPTDAPSNLAFAGRYIFMPDIFDFLMQTGRGKHNEIQLTDAMRQMAQSRPMFGARIEGKRHDIGNKLDFIKTNIYYALKHPELKEPLSEYIKELVGNRFQ